MPRLFRVRLVSAQAHQEDQRRHQLGNAATRQQAFCAGEQRRIVIDHGWQVRRVDAVTDQNNEFEQGCELSGAEEFRLKRGDVNSARKAWPAQR